MAISITEVEAYLNDVKEAIARDQYQIDMNLRRPDNRALFAKYVISEAQARDILLSLTPEDFSEVRNNEHKGYEHELLYIFGKDVPLLERYGDDLKTVSLYIKFNKLENQYVIVISFHEQKYPLKYPFK